MNIISPSKPKVLYSKVIRENMANCCGKSNFSNCSGCSSGIDGADKKSVNDFQVWANGFHDAKLKEDGVYGDNSKAAYKKWGAEWEKSQATPAPIKKDEPKKEEAKPADPIKSTLSDKWKALSKTKKGLIIGGGALATIGLVVLIYKIVK